MGSRIAGVTPWGSFMHKILPVFVVLVLSAFSQALLAVDSDDPGANYQGPQSGTLECTGAPIPQNAEYVFSQHAAGETSTRVQPKDLGWKVITGPKTNADVGSEEYQQWPTEEMRGALDCRSLAGSGGL